jgi:hypothetical protein
VTAERTVRAVTEGVAIPAGAATEVATVEGVVLKASSARCSSAVLPSK